jgi:hypothetical protein
VSDVLRLEADDDAVLALTARALAESRGTKPSLDVRCADCGASLGGASRTPTGILFMSWWEVDVAPDFTIEATTRRRRRSGLNQWDPDLPMVAQPPTATGHATTRHGVIALLTLPPDLPDDYPDLLVRCAEHGDGVLDADQVVGQVPSRGHRRWKVPLRPPHLAYREPQAFVRPTRWHED